MPSPFCIGSCCSLPVVVLCKICSVKIVENVFFTFLFRAICLGKMASERLWRRMSPLSCLLCKKLLATNNELFVSFNCFPDKNIQILCKTVWKGKTKWYKRVYVLFTFTSSCFRLSHFRSLLFKTVHNFCKYCNLQ